MKFMLHKSIVLVHVCVCCIFRLVYDICSTWVFYLLCFKIIGCISNFLTCNSYNCSVVHSFLYFDQMFVYSFNIFRLAMHKYLLIIIIIVFVIVVVFIMLSFVLLFIMSFILESRES